MAGKLESRIIPLSDQFIISSPYQSKHDDPNSEIIRPEEPWYEAAYKGQEVTGASLFSLPNETHALILGFNGAKKGIQILLNGTNDQEQDLTRHFIGSEFWGKSVDVPHGLFPTKGLIFTKPDGVPFCLECSGSVPCPAEKAPTSLPAGGFSLGQPLSK